MYGSCRIIRNLNPAFDPHQRLKLRSKASGDKLCSLRCGRIVWSCSCKFVDYQQRLAVLVWKSDCKTSAVNNNICIAELPNDKLSNLDFSAAPQWDTMQHNKNRNCLIFTSLLSAASGKKIVASATCRDTRYGIPHYLSTLVAELVHIDTIR